MPDDSVFTPGSQFTKVWRLRNNGTCTWTRNYRLVFVNGDRMSGVSNTPLPVDVAPGQTIDLAMNFTAPFVEGDYRGNWMLRNERGELFGTTAANNRPFWVDIIVRAPAVSGTVYDFVANVCSAQWSSGAGTLPCPGTNRDANGFVLRQTNARLEDGTTSFNPSLVTVPQSVNNGFIRAVYPSFRVQTGDRLQMIVSCESGATACGVLYRVDYQLADGVVRDFWAFGEQYDNRYFVVDLDLSPLAGQNVKIVFTILSLGDASNDRALWVNPRIVRTPR